VKVVTKLCRHQFGDRKAAIATLERLLSSREGNHFASVDAGLKWHKTRHNLGAWLCEEGRHREAEEQWRLALHEAPAFLPSLVSLAQLGIDRGRPELVDEMLPRLDRHPQGRVEAALLRGRADAFLFGEVAFVVVAVVPGSVRGQAANVPPGSGSYF
jgi:hypothetical protein